ncbi:retrovirus-related pol polyprotein from transposon TNT 1-94, partial [Tanacetum coccineum]
MMKRIVENTHGHPLKDQKLSKIDKVPLCTSCSLGKLIARPSPLKVENESPMFFERIQGDICGPIHPPCGPFRYFMVLIDVSSRWSHVSLLSTCNVAFAKFLAQIIKLRAHFPDYTVKRVRLDNAGEFISHAFNDYCMSARIVVEHPVAYVHTQNGHAILHVASLIRTRPSANHKYSPIQLASGQEPNFSHLRIFGCAVYVLIAPPQRTKMGPQRRLGIYVGYETSSIIRYIKPLTGDLFTTRFADCHFDEAVFSKLGGVKKNQEKDVTWCEPSLLYLDPRTKQCETELLMPPTRVEIPNKQVGDNIAQESQKCLKRRRPINSKDKNSRKRKGTEKNSCHDENVFDETQDIKTSPEEEMNDINKEIRPDYDTWKDAMQAELNSLNERKVFRPIVTTPRDVKPKTTFGFIIIAVYVDDLNIIGTNKEINEVVMHLKEEFEIKDL